MDKIQWFGYNGHQRTDEELLYALHWCERNQATVKFSQGRALLRLPDKRHPVRAYDVADCVKSAIENHGRSE